MSDEKNNIIKSTKSGRLYIETIDFLKQQKVRDTIKLLLDSDLIKDIDNKRREQQKAHV